MKRAKGVRRQRTESYLLAHNLSPREAREFSILPLNHPTLKAIIRDRARRRRDFERIAVGKLERNQWGWQDVEKKWIQSINRMYRARGWMIKSGPESGASVWAMFRYFEKSHPPKKGVSPWQLKHYPGKKRLERGLIFVKQLEKGTKKASPTQILHWITQKQEAIRKTRDKTRRAQLRVEITRLERLIA